MAISPVMNFGDYGAFDWQRTQSNGMVTAPMTLDLMQGWVDGLGGIDTEDGLPTHEFGFCVACSDGEVPAATDAVLRALKAAVWGYRVAVGGKPLAWRDRPEVSVRETDGGLLVSSFARLGVAPEAVAAAA